ETELRLLALARSAGSFLQRVLSYEREAAVVVYEAPSGVPIGEAGPLEPLRAARLLQRLARAGAPLHEGGHAPGAVGPATGVGGGLAPPTVLASGLAAAPPAGAASPAADVAALVGLVARRVGAGPSAAELVATLAAGLEPAERAAFESRASAPPGSGEALFQI